MHRSDQDCRLPRRRGPRASPKTFAVSFPAHVCFPTFASGSPAGGRDRTRNVRGSLCAPLHRHELGGFPASSIPIAVAHHGCGEHGREHRGREHGGLGGVSDRRVVIGQIADQQRDGELNPIAANNAAGTRSRSVKPSGNRRPGSRHARAAPAVIPTALLRWSIAGHAEAGLGPFPVLVRWRV